MDLVCKDKDNGKKDSGREEKTQGTGLEFDESFYFGTSLNSVQEFPVRPTSHLLTGDRTVGLTVCPRLPKYIDL